MRLKISQAAKNKHSKLVVDVGWAGNELYSVSDDKTIQRHTIDGADASAAAAAAAGKSGAIGGSGGAVSNDLKQFEGLGDVFATCFHWLTAQNNAPELFALGCSSGAIRLMTRTGRLEREIKDAHSGAVTSLRWNDDGTGFISGGEDGMLKYWSRNGNLRSKLAQSDRAIYSVVWSPDCQSVLYASGQYVAIVPATAATASSGGVGGGGGAASSAGKAIKWKAHDATVLKVDWNAINNLIVTGGEDKRYKVWDSFGRPQFTSKANEFGITAVRWAPNGNYFAVGSFDAVTLCDKTGWTHSRETTKSGSILALDWTSDSTHLAGAGANGAVCFGQIVERSLEWKNYEITLTASNQVVVTDVTSESGAPDEFEFGGGRVIEMSLAWNHLVVCTDKKCYVYMLQNLSTPQVMDLVGGGSVNLILQSERYFLLVDNVRGIQVFTYEGKPVSNPRVAANLRPQLLRAGTLALSDDVIALVDRTNPRHIHLLDTVSGKALSAEPLAHTLDVVDIALNQAGSVSERKLLFFDRNRDLFVTPIIRAHGTAHHKLATMVDTAAWNETTDILAAVSDAKLTVWYCPAAAFVDKDLLHFTRTQTDAAHFGKGSQLIAFHDTRLSVRKADGATLTAAINPAPAYLHRYCLTGQWQKAVRLCRWAPAGGGVAGSGGAAVGGGSSSSGSKEEVMWSTLAVLSIAAQQLDTAELALSALDEVDKVQFVQYIKTVPSVEGRNAELLLYRRRPDDAEAVLLQAKLIYRAIHLNLRIFRWHRALDLAVQHKTHIDTVLHYRAQYLAGFAPTAGGAAADAAAAASSKQQETDKRFLQMAVDVKVDAKMVADKEQLEREAEEKRGTPYKPVADTKIDTKIETEAVPSSSFGGSAPSPVHKTESPLAAASTALTGDLDSAASGSGAPPPMGGRRAASTISKTPLKKGANDQKAEGARPAVKKGTRIDIDND